MADPFFSAKQTKSLIQTPCVTCGRGESSTKTRQSPIDISQDVAILQDFRALALTGHERLSVSMGSLILRNTGTTLKMTADLGVAVLEGGPLNVKYNFVEMHFHWGNLRNNDLMGSEHRIDGQSFPLELHMVHKNCHDETVTDALKHENGLCVLGLVFQLVDDDDETPTPALDALEEISLRHLKKSGDQYDRSHLEEDFNVANFLPAYFDEYFTYRGSLTTGGCQEAVNWILFRRPLVVKKHHLLAFQSLLTEDGECITNNFKPPQNANGRPVYYYGNELAETKRIKPNKAGVKSVKPHPLTKLMIKDCAKEEYKEKANSQSSTRPSFTSEIAFDDEDIYNMTKRVERLA